jgi:hypothetical protein
MPPRNAVVGLDHGKLEVGAVVFEVAEQSADGRLGVDRGALGGVGEPHCAAAFVADGELVERQVQLFGLREVARLVLEVLGVDLQALEGRQTFLDLAEVVLALVFFARFAGEAVFACAARRT